MHRLGNTHVCELSRHLMYKYCCSYYASLLIIFCNIVLCYFDVEKCYKTNTGGASELELVFAEVTLSKITHAQSE